MLPSAELGKGNHHIITTDYLKLFPAGYPKLCDFYSMAFFLLVLASMPLRIKNTIAILAPGSNTFAVLVKCIHVKDCIYYSTSSNKFCPHINIIIMIINSISADNNYCVDDLVRKRRLL